jgi:RNA polymerase sigma factor (sigma-70 family)
MSDALSDYLRSIDHPVLSAEDEQLLAKRIQGDDPADAEAAVQELVRHNTRLVVSVAKRLYRPLRMDLDDAIAYGNVALVRAARSFKPRGLKFSTLASTAITREIQRASAFASADQPLPARLGRGNAARYDDHLYDTSRAFATANSLDAPLAGHDDNRIVADVVADESAPDPAALTDRADRHEEFYRMLRAKLTEEQLDAFVRVYVDGASSRTPDRALHDVAYEARCIIRDDEAFREHAAEMLGALGIRLAA